MRLAPILIAAFLASTAARSHEGIAAELKVLDERLRAQPSDAAALLDRAELHRLAGAPAHAAEDALRARGLLPGAPDAPDASVARRAALELGLALHALGHDDEASRELAGFVASGTGTLEAYVALAEIEMKKGRTTEAARAYRQAISLRPRPDEVLLLARLQIAEGDLSGAASTLEDGLARLSGAMVIRLALIDVERARGRTAHALYLVDEVLPTLPVRTKWLLLRADVLAAAGRTDEARADRGRALAAAERAFSRRPTPQLRLARARALWSLGKHAEARRDVALVLDRAPRDRDALALLASLDGT